MIAKLYIISGLKKEKRLDGKIASKFKTELEILNNIQMRLGEIKKELRIFREKRTRRNIVQRQN